MKKTFLVLSALSLAIVAGCNYKAGADGSGAGGSGGSSADKCPARGSVCSSDDEGDACNDAVLCHCNRWITSNDSSFGESCGATNSCNAGDPCKNEGAECSGFVCHCGVWISPSLAPNFTCGSSGNTGNGAGNGSGTGAGSGSGGGPVSSYTVRFRVHAYDYHSWCQGGAHDLEGNWFEPFHSFAGDAYGPKEPPGNHPTSMWLDYDVTVTVSGNAFLEAQCYLNRSGNETSGDNVRYTFADPSMLQSGEWVKIDVNGTPISWPSSEAWWVNNGDPQGFSENLLIAPPKH